MPGGSVAPKPRVVLLSTYDLGRQPFGLASPAAWLERAGFEVACNDLAVDALDLEAIRGATVAAFHLPMHTATRLAIRALERVRAARPDLPVIFYGLYAAMNAPFLRSLGAAAVIGGEFEQALARAVVAIAARAATPAVVGAGTDAERPASGGGTAEEPAAALDEAPEEIPLVPLERLAFQVPERRALPPLERYARLIVDGEERLVGSTEASRGCRHLCRHCPVVPVYRGRFRIVPREVVLEDVARQVAAGARHITFGDPDFWNGIGHARPLVRDFHRRFPDVSYDVTIKIEHLVRYADLLVELRDTGCAFVTSAVESVDDAVLARLEKGHTCADFERVVERFRAAGLALHPTFVAFTPWTTVRGWQDLLAAVAGLELVPNVAAIQLAIRLLIPAGSRLLELEEVRALAGPFDPVALVHRWRHPDPAVDELQREAEALVTESACHGESRGIAFERLWALAERSPGAVPRRLDPVALAPPRAPVPFLTEPWYC